MPEAVSTAEVVVTMLANDDAVRAVALGGDGVAGALAEGALYADSSTVSPMLSAEVANAVGADRFVALPVLGAPAAVAGGSAVFLAGGADGTIDRLGAVLQSLAGTVRRYPEARLATTAKLASNFLLLSGLVALAEAMAIGRSGGLGDDQIRDLLAASPLVAPALGNRFEGVLTGQQEPWWSPALGAKDARLGLELAETGGTKLPLGQVVLDRYQAAADRHVEADVDITAVAEPYQP